MKVSAFITVQQDDGSPEVRASLVTIPPAAGRQLTNADLAAAAAMQAIKNLLVAPEPQHGLGAHVLAACGMLAETLHPGVVYQFGINPEGGGAVAGMIFAVGGADHAKDLQEAIDSLLSKWNAEDAFKRAPATSGAVQ